MVEHIYIIQNRQFLLLFVQYVFLAPNLAVCWGCTAVQACIRIIGDDLKTYAPAWWPIGTYIPIFAVCFYSHTYSVISIHLHFTTASKWVSQHVISRANFTQADSFVSSIQKFMTDRSLLLSLTDIHICKDGCIPWWTDLMNWLSQPCKSLN